MHDICLSQGDNLVLERLRTHCDRPVINLKVSNCECLRVHKEVSVRVGNLVQIEIDHSISQVVVSLFQCKLIVVLDFFDQLLANVCLLFRENHC